MLSDFSFKVVFTLPQVLKNLIFGILLKDDVDLMSLEVMDESLTDTDFIKKVNENLNSTAS